MHQLKIIALDLEGTLISNAMSQIPRPGLFEFLDGCKSITNRVVMYTTVPETLFRDIATLLVSEGKAPRWFEAVEYVNWEGKAKDLTFIPGNNDVESSVLVDDFHEYVHPGQESQWVEIKQFEHPYSDDDTELSCILNRLIANTKSKKL